MEKKYVGNGRVIETKFGNMLKLSLTESDVKTLSENLKDGWVNLDVKKRREPSKGGMTHYLEVNTFVKKEPKNEYVRETIKEIKEEPNHPF